MTHPTPCFNMSKVIVWNVTLPRGCLLRLMEWSGRAPAPSAIKAGKGCEHKEHAMSHTLNTDIAVVGIDIGKNSLAAAPLTGVKQRSASIPRSSAAADN